MAGPFPAGTVEAVGACTRAIAGERAATAVEGLEALLGFSDAATVSGLRAFGDRLAVRQRFHDGALFERLQPAEQPAGALFAALEDARLDALGVAWLAGVARNLLSHPGAANDGVRWLAFEIFS